ncbi:MAG: hypothetical protein NE334_05465 [Lentisphaeraceae bacterium]|nr:hypothetical protein [Lentisphaeraceae bacterium]
MSILILGKGYVGKALCEEFPEATGTRRKVTNPQTPSFDLENEITWKNIPSAETIIWTFPACPVEKVEKFYNEKLLSCKNLIVLASTSRYVVKRQKQRIDENTDIDKTLIRVKGEEYLKSQGATILALAGIYGPNRDPYSWLTKGLIRNPKKMLNLIHLDDIVNIIKVLIKNPKPNEIYNLADGEAKSWQEIGEKADFHFRMPGERELSKIISNDKIKSILPENYQFRDLYTSWELHKN